MSEVNILDASAVLALLKAEKGHDIVQSAMRSRVSRISTVNLSEVIAKLCENGLPNEAALTVVNTLNLQTTDFDPFFAARTAFLKAPTKSIGASLGDRACLALAAALMDQADDPLVYTAEKLSAKLKWPFKIILIR